MNARIEDKGNALESAADRVCKAIISILLAKSGVYISEVNHITPLHAAAHRWYHSPA